MSFYSGASTILTQNLKVVQSTPEKYSCELRFSQDHKSEFIFNVACEVMEKWIFIVAPPPFLLKIWKLLIGRQKKYFFEVHKFNFFPVACQVTEKWIFIPTALWFLHKIWKLLKFLRKVSISTKILSGWCENCSRHLGKTSAWKRNSLRIMNLFLFFL